jgi:hypothetical protein
MFCALVSQIEEKFTSNNSAFSSHIFNEAWYPKSVDGAKWVTSVEWQYTTKFAFLYPD